jgi:hypothetical protein
VRLLWKSALLTCTFLFLLYFPLHASNNRALLIGISQYNELDCLAYADVDVRAFADILTGFAGYKPSDIVVVLNHKATKARIERELDRAIKLSKNKPINHFIIMFTGHGVPGEIQRKHTGVFLAPSDASREKFYLYRGELLNETFIHKAWLAKQLASINARSIILIIDSCYSGIKDFGELFVKNFGYRVSFLGGGGALKSVMVVKRKGSGQSLQRKIALLASSREDQPSAEYTELRHGALSYCIFEHLNGLRKETDYEEWRDVSVGSVYSNVSKLFDEVTVQGKPLSDVHQPILFPIPDYENVERMQFVSIRGARKKIIRKGIIDIITDPPGAEVYVDSVNTGKRSNCTLELLEGKHQIALFLKRTNYRHTFTTEIKYGHTERKEISLRGDLTVESFWKKKGGRIPGPGLKVYVDGKYKGATRLFLKNLIAGAHHLEVKYAKVTKRRRIEIRPYSPLLVKYTIIRKPATKDETRDSAGDVLF